MLHRTLVRADSGRTLMLNVLGRETNIVPAVRQQERCTRAAVVGRRFVVSVAKSRSPRQRHSSTQKRVEPSELRARNAPRPNGEHLKVSENIKRSSNVLPRRACVSRTVATAGNRSIIGRRVDVQTRALRNVNCDLKRIFKARR